MVGGEGNIGKGGAHGPNVRETANRQSRSGSAARIPPRSVSRNVPSSGSRSVSRSKRKTSTTRSVRSNSSAKNRKESKNTYNDVVDRQSAPAAMNTAKSSEQGSGAPNGGAAQTSQGYGTLTRPISKILQSYSASRPSPFFPMNGASRSSASRSGSVNSTSRVNAIARQIKNNNSPSTNSPTTGGVGSASVSRSRSKSGGKNTYGGVAPRDDRSVSPNVSKSVRRSKRKTSTTRSVNSNNSASVSRNRIQSKSIYKGVAIRPGIPSPMLNTARSQHSMVSHIPNMNHSITVPRLGRPNSENVTPVTGESGKEATNQSDLSASRNSIGHVLDKKSPESSKALSSSRNI